MSHDIARWGRRLPHDTIEDTHVRILSEFIELTTNKMKTGKINDVFLTNDVSLSLYLYCNTHMIYHNTYTYIYMKLGMYTYLLTKRFTEFFHNFFRHSKWVKKTVLPGQLGPGRNSLHCAMFRVYSETWSSFSKRVNTSKRDELTKHRFNCRFSKNSKWLELKLLGGTFSSKVGKS